MEAQAVELIGERVRVRRFQAADVAPFQRYRDDRGTASLQGWERPYTRAHAETFVSWAMAAPLGAPGAWAQLAVERVATPGLVGDVGVHTVGGAAVELGVTFAPEARGAGLATEAVRLVLGHMAAVHGKRLARGYVDVANARSLALFERLGFARVRSAIAADGEGEHVYELALGAA